MVSPDQAGQNNRNRFNRTSNGSHKRVTFSVTRLGFTSLKSLFLILFCQTKKMNWKNWSCIMHAEGSHSQMTNCVTLHMNWQ